MQTAVNTPHSTRAFSWLAAQASESFELLCSQRPHGHQDRMTQVRRHIAALPARFNSKASDGGTMEC
jgi:hypothetical protein